MSFLLDTDICSAYVKGDRTVFGRFLQHLGQLHISVATLGELWTWGLRANAPARRLTGLTNLLSDVTVLDATPPVARKFGEVEAQLLDRGHAVTEFDLLIAATALVHDLTLVPHNVQDFAHVPCPRVADWLNP